ncbi:MAG: hypothetical protein HY691_15330 [Chloroflexi bacterium]|nr:hypothetical protein [Chloroflexota bacterium]
MTLPRVVALETYELRLPPLKDFRWQSLTEPLGSFFVVRLIAEDGTEGLGEVVPLKDWGGDHGRQYGETPTTAAHVVHEYLAPVVFAESPGDVGRIHARWDAVVKGHPYAKAAVDVALHDLVGRALGVPVYQLLGGRCRESVPIAHMLGILPLDEVVAEARAAWADGLRAFQIKGGRDAARDGEVVAALRATLGPAVFLRLDANQGYATPKAAIAALRPMEAARLDAAEQPVAGLAALAEVRSAVAPLVIADESCWSAADALALAQARAVDAISIYVGMAGGLYPARQVAAVAAAAGLPHDVNGSLELGIGSAANVHLAIAAPAATLASVTPIAAPADAAPTQVGGRYFADDVVSAPFLYRDGAVAPLDRPGLGVALDEARLRRYAVVQRRSER